MFSSNCLGAQESLERDLGSAEALMLIRGGKGYKCFRNLDCNIQQTKFYNI